MAGKFQPYRGEKRRKETARKTKQEEKLRKKLERKESVLPTGDGEQGPETELEEDGASNEELPPHPRS
jgi:hypothetical protein